MENDDLNQMAARARHFASRDELVELETAMSAVRGSSDLIGRAQVEHKLQRSKVISICRGIEARLSKGEPELADVITSGPVS